MTYLFACECQAVADVFLDNDWLRLFDALHRVFRAWPTVLSPQNAFPITMAIAGFGERILRCDLTLPSNGITARFTTHERVCQALSRVLQWHTRHSLTLSAIAESLGIGVPYLSDAINRVSRRGFFAHLHAIRVLHATVALSNTDDPVDVIAHNIGYAGASHLDRRFHRHLHTTPTRFRSLVRQ